MPQILKLSVKLIFSLAVILVCGNCFAQYAIKRTVKNGTTLTEVSEYYTYKRLADSYNALSFRPCIATKPGSTATFKLGVIYTSAAGAIAQAIKFQAAADSSLYITGTLTPAGNKSIDDPKLNSTIYTVNITDSLKTFLFHQPIKQVSVFDAQGRQLVKLSISDPSFLIQQLNCLRAPQKRKPAPIKKAHKHSS